MFDCLEFGDAAADLVLFGVGLGEELVGLGLGYHAEVVRLGLCGPHPA